MLKFRQLNMTHEESYYLTGKKYLFSINISKYDQQENDRNGSEFDEKNIVNTLKERFRNYRTLKFLQLKKLEMNLRKETVGFEVKFRKNGRVTKDEVKGAICRFADGIKSRDKIRLLAFVFMGHGSEGDW